MTKFYKIIAALLLLFNGTGAIYGGWNLIIHPDGSSIQLSPMWLEHTPFHSYLIPGIILFFANGMLSIFVFITILLNRKTYPFGVMAQGVILTGWIVIQMLLVQTVYFLHIVMGSTGLLLILIGWLMKKKINTQTATN